MPSIQRSRIKKRRGRGVAYHEVLDQQDWSVSAPTFVIHAKDPLDDMDQGF
jgi:hypothetical protein